MCLRNIELLVDSEKFLYMAVNASSAFDDVYINEKIHFTTIANVYFNHAFNKKNLLKGIEDLLFLKKISSNKYKKRRKCLWGN